jgi:hypothetical protein
VVPHVFNSWAMPPAISNSSRESSAAADGDKDPQKTPKNKVMVVIDKVTAFAYPGNVSVLLVGAITSGP